LKITAIDTHLVNMGNRNVPFVLVRTDEGITGVGEAYSCGPDKATVEVIRDFALWLAGRDPRDIESLYQLMFAGSRFPGGSVVGSAISGIEHALWDIAGKAAGVPVYRMLGGRCRDKVRVYQNPGGKTPEEMADNALKAIAKYGYTALKLSPLPPDYATLPWGRVVAESVRRCEAVRRAVGDDIDIGIDPHAKIFEPAQAIELARALEPMRPFFIEEPLRPENRAALAKVREHVRVPIATGEMLYTRYEFRELLALQAVDIVQPDVCVAGGLFELKKIAAMAEAHYVTVAPHNPCGPVATAVNVHFAASTSNFNILEYIPDDSGVRNEVVKEPIRLSKGYLEIPEKPGLGVELDEKAAARHPFVPWHRPFNVRQDGSLAYQ
jgi:galactonate dehydratase